MDPHAPATVVGEWQDAANRRDAERLTALSAPDIELVGPRGVARGTATLREWLVRAGLHVEPRRVFARPGDHPATGSVVVEQHATWHDPTGRETGSATVASAFTVADGRVSRYSRHEALADALTTAGLTTADEVFRG